jgi:hypothetical protein
MVMISGTDFERRVPRLDPKGKPCRLGRAATAARLALARQAVAPVVCLIGTCIASLNLHAAAQTAPATRAESRTIAVFDEQPIEFDKTVVDGAPADETGDVRLFRTGQQVERALDLPPFPRDLRDAQRILATLIIEPVVLETEGKIRPADPWTRLGSVTIAVDSHSPLAPTSQPVTPRPPSTAHAGSDEARPGSRTTTQPATRPASATPISPASQPDADEKKYPISTAAPGEIEIMRFVTPFGGPATYTADLTAFAPLLAGKTSLRVWISTWKQPAWKVTLTLTYSDEGVGYRRPLFAQPLFNAEVTAEKRVLRSTIRIPRGVARPRIHVLSTGHATDGAGGDEFISRTHVLRVDGQEVARWRPWSEGGGPLRDMNPTAGRLEIDGRSLWATDLDRSGWHPGLLVEPFQTPLPELTAGQHTIELEIVGIRPRDQSGYGYWRVSAIAVADEPWPSEDGQGPEPEN